MFNVALGLTCHGSEVWWGRAVQSMTDGKQGAAKGKGQDRIQLQSHWPRSSSKTPSSHSATTSQQSAQNLNPSVASIIDEAMVRQAQETI